MRARVVKWAGLIMPLILAWQRKDEASNKFVPCHDYRTIQGDV